MRTLISQEEQNTFWNLSHSVLQRTSTPRSMWGVRGSWQLLFVKRQVAAFWNRWHQVFWCFKRSLCSFKHKKGQYYRLQVRDMRSIHHLTEMRVAPSWDALGYKHTWQWERRCLLWISFLNPISRCFSCQVWAPASCLLSTCRPLLGTKK